jgi:ribosomal 30S subunit maturation factor RimM
LKGCEFDGAKANIGVVTDVLDSGGTEILKSIGEEETLIPFAQPYLKKIDLDQRNQSSICRRVCAN